MKTAKEKEQREERISVPRIREADILERFIRSPGPGGQKVNKTSACVYLKHLPTGIEVKCRQERSQALNRFIARRILADKIERLFRERARKEKSDIERSKRQKRKRSKKTQVRILEEKRRHSRKKAFRAPVREFD